MHGPLCSGQRQQGRDAAQFARRPRCRACSTRSTSACDAGVAGHHRASARRSAPHHARGRARHRRARSRAGARRSNTTSKAIRGPICSSSCTRFGRISARSCRSCPVRSRARPAGAGGPQTRSASRDRRRPARRAASASACSSIPTPEAVRLAASVGADRVELYTEPFARAFERGADAGARGRSPTTPRRRELAHSLGLGVNAGHDLDLDNLVLFRELPHLDEVSIGHAIMSRALFVGLDTVVREYLRRAAPGSRRVERRADSAPARRSAIVGGLASATAMIGGRRRHRRMSHRFHP